MCCGKVCMLCTCLIVVLIAVGMVFGFGVFRNGFHKVKETLHYQYGSSSAAAVGRPFLGVPAPPPF